MFCVVSHGVSDRGRCQSRDLCSLVPTRTGAGCGGCGREEEAKIFFVKVCFSKAKILIACRCGGWGRQEEAKIFVAFHFIYRGGSAAGGDRQADRRISTYTHTHTCTSTHQTHPCNQAHSEMLWTHKNAVGRFGKQFPLRITSLVVE